MPQYRLAFAWIQGAKDRPETMEIEMVVDSLQDALREITTLLGEGLTYVNISLIDEPQ